MRGLDDWLEAPYVDAARREADFERFCEQNDVDPESPTAWDEYDAFLEDAAYDAELDAAERQADYDREER